MIPAKSPRGAPEGGSPILLPRPAPHQGWLLKKGGVRKNWKRRLFVLEDGVMRYYAVDKNKQKEQKGSFTIKDTPCGPAAGATGKKYNSAFQVQTPKRTYFMITESLEDLALWQRALVLHGGNWNTAIADTSPLLLLHQQSLTSPRLDLKPAKEIAASTATLRRQSIGSSPQLIDTILLSDAIRYPLLTLHMKYVGAGGEVYLNGKLISNYKASATVNRHIVALNQWVLFEEPPNALSALFKFPESDYFTDVLPKLTISFMVRDWNDETWISVGHKIRFTLSTATRDPIVTVLPDKEKTDEILQIALISRKKSRMYLSFSMRFSVFGTPYPMWMWAPTDSFPAGVETSQLRLEVFDATYTIYRMLVERKDAELKALFTPLLKDLAYTSLKIAKCSGVEAKAIEELWQSCFVTWLDDPNYKLTHMSKKDKEYRIATCGRFVTLVTPKDDWPIIFTGRQKKLPDEPMNFVFVRLNGRLQPAMFWQGPFP